MCGIIGYKGPRNGCQIVLDGLKDLEYRGYDSWGIAALSDQIKLVKNVGKISAVSLGDLNLPFANLAIGHTRWATHGGVCQKNAHPHFSQSESFALVQNGIVENYQELRGELKSKGYQFNTETDTEVIVRLIEQQFSCCGNLKESISRAFKKLKGRNAIVVIDKESHHIYAARNGSPLMLGIGEVKSEHRENENENESGKVEKEFILASDPSPLLKHTKKIIFLDDQEFVSLNEDYHIYDLETDKEIIKEVQTLTWDPEQAKKGDYPHFMLKEIMEQKETISQALVQDPELIQTIAQEINRAFGVYAVGCGTAGKVCLAGTYAFSELAKKHINFAFGSEFPNFHNFIQSRSLLLVVSQSGETADTLEAIKTIQEKNGKVISLVNVMGSTIMRKSDYSLLINAGPEIAVASTKATTSQLALMTLLAYACANRYEEGLQALKDTAEAISHMLDNNFNDHIQQLAKTIEYQRDIYIIGRGNNYAIALESAIKIQEVSYVHAEGFAGGELKHGPIALIQKGTPCIVLVANDHTKDDILSNAIEIKARGGFIIGIAPENNEIFDYWIKVPDISVTSPIINVIPVQLLAYHLAVAKGLDPDKPRNLAKSVTVK